MKYSVLCAFYRLTKTVLPIMDVNARRKFCFAYFEKIARGRNEAYPQYGVTVSLIQINKFILLIFFIGIKRPNTNLSGISPEMLHPSWDWSNLQLRVNNPNSFCLNAGSISELFPFERIVFNFIFKMQEINPPSHPGCRLSVSLWQVYLQRRGVILHQECKYKFRGHLRP